MARTVFSHRPVAAGLTPLEVAKAEANAAVNARRDQRIAGGFTFMGHAFQSRASDRENIMGAAQAAFMAVASGAQEGDLRWADPDSDFGWITADNAVVPMDAQTVIGLFQFGVAFKSAQTFYARGLKDLIDAAEDVEAVAAIDLETGWP